MIDALDVLPCLNFAHLPDDSAIPQLSDDKIPLSIRIRIGRVSDLERELSQREPGILGPSSDPVNVASCSGRSVLSQNLAVPHVASTSDVSKAQNRM